MKVDLNEFKNKSVNVVYHKNCIDGIFAAGLMKIMTATVGIEANFIACQYNEELVIPGNGIVIFVDFSLKYPQMEYLTHNYEAVYVFDHHGTANIELEPLGDEYDNFFLFFDGSVCGTEVVYNNLYDAGIYPKINDDFIKSITDMDLFKFKYSTTKSLRAILDFKTQKKDIDKAVEILLMDDSGISALAIEGNILTDYIWAGAEKVSKTLLKKKIAPINICGNELIAINNSSNISEVGNQICEDMKYMSLQYFILENMNVVCSLRSNSNLGDASKIASFFGGGGHRDACGFQIPFDQLGNMLKNGFSDVVRFKAEAIIYKLVDTELIEIPVKGYFYISKAGRPLMFSMGSDKELQVYHYKNNDLKNIKVDYSTNEI